MLNLIKQYIGLNLEKTYLYKIVDDTVIYKNLYVDKWNELPFGIKKEYTLPIELRHLWKIGYAPSNGDICTILYDYGIENNHESAHIYLVRSLYCKHIYVIASKGIERIL